MDKRNKIITLFIAIFLTVFQVLSQDHELSVQYRFGTPTQNHTLQETDESNVINYLEVRSQYDHGTILSYSYNVWKAQNLYLSGGLEYSVSKHNQPVVSTEAIQQLDNILISSKRYSYRFGLNKQFSLYDSKMFLDFGVHFVKRNPVKMRVDYKRDMDFSQREWIHWIEYGYELNAYYDGRYDESGFYDNTSPFNVFHWNTEFSMTLKWKLYEWLLVNMGFSYSRNNIFYYDYTFDVNIYHNNSETPTASDTQLPFKPDNPEWKQQVRNHFVYINFGVTFKLNN